MVDSFSQLKKNRKNQLEKLAQEASKLSNNNANVQDERYWTPTIDAVGNGSAIIRFLPAPPNEDVPFVRYWDHGFQGPGGWYIEKSLTSIGLEDPVGEYNSKLWNSGVESDKEIARAQKRRLHYVSNIYVIRDPGNPDNEGKVFLYEYGKKIFDKLNDAMHPEEELGEEPFNPFDLWEGANFRLRIRKVEGWRNYDKSGFDNPSPLSDDDEELERIWKSSHSLKEIVDPKNFKSYSELKARLERVLGSDYSSSARSAEESVDDDDTPPWQPPKEEKQVTQKSSPEEQAPDKETDDTLEFFKELSKED